MTPIGEAEVGAWWCSCRQSIITGWGGTLDFLSHGFAGRDHVIGGDFRTRRGSNRPMA